MMASGGMVEPGSRDAEKRAAALAAIEEVRDGMIVGLGTGSTAAFAIEALARRYREGLLNIRTTATSLKTAGLARQHGLPVLSFEDLTAIDLCIDGVDEIDEQMRAVKGAGGAMLREKIVAQAATRMVAICDSAKQVKTLGTKPLPIEVLPFARAWILDKIIGLGVTPSLRSGDDAKPFLTDQGNVVIDCHLEGRIAHGDFAEALEGLPGMLGHGLFSTEIDALYVGIGERVECVQRIHTP